MADAQIPIRLQVHVDLRERALQLAISSSAGAGTAQIVDRAVWFEKYLRTGGTGRPHHACKEAECSTPSGKIACHTCGEAWPCTSSSA